MYHFVWYGAGCLLPYVPIGFGKGVCYKRQGNLMYGIGVWKCVSPKLYTEAEGFMENPVS